MHLQKPTMRQDENPSHKQCMSTLILYFVKNLIYAARNFPLVVKWWEKWRLPLWQQIYFQDVASARNVSKITS